MMPDLLDVRNNKIKSDFFLFEWYCLSARDEQRTLISFWTQKE